MKRQTPAWYWATPAMPAGDLYHIGSLAADFRRMQGWDHPIVLITTKPYQASMATLYDEYFDELILEPDLPLTREEWSRFYNQEDLPYFGLNTPVVLQPYISPIFQPQLVDYSLNNGVGWLQMNKQILGLRPDAEPFPPLRRPARVEAARRLCAEHEMPGGRTVLLFPHAKTCHAHTVDAFALLAATLAGQGWCVVTSVAAGEAAIEGSRPLFIPFELLVDVADHCGWAVVARSGVADAISSSTCRKTVAYRNDYEVWMWNLRFMELAADAHEFSFAFGLDDPQRFVAQTLRGADEVQRSTPTRRISDDVGLGNAAASVHRLSFATLQRDPADGPRRLERAWRPIGSDPFALVLTDVPAQPHPRWGDLIGQANGLLAGFAATAAVRYYVCRDGLKNAWFEEIAADALRSDDYASSGRWRTVIATCNASLEALLPDAFQGRVGALESFTLGRRVHLYAPEVRQAHVDSLRWSRPLSFGGVRLSEGWYPGEGWGAWSEGERCGLEFVLQARPTQDLVFRMGYGALVSETFPELSFTISANGAELSRHIVVYEVGPSELATEIPVRLGAARSTLKIEIRFDQVRSPAQLGLSGDPRPLGLGLHWVELAAA